MRLPIRLLFPILSLCAAGAANGANLDAVTASPDPGTAGQQITITASKSGPENCGWLVNYGDGTSSQPMGFPGATKSVQHEYSAPGTYTIHVAGANHGNKPQCNDSASHEIEVKPAHGPGGGTLEISKVADLPLGLKPNDPTLQISELCKQINCKGLVAIPNVEGHFGLTRPGGVVAWKGKGFAGQGKVTLSYVDWKNNPKTATLEILEWKNGLLGTKIPAGLTGFRAQTASIVVTNEAGNKSAPYAFALHPTLDSVDLKRQHVKIVHCSQAANIGACDMLDFSGDPPIPAMHKNKWGAIGDDQGTDKYEIKVKNGWVISWTKTNKWGTSNDEWVNGPSDGAGVGLATWTPSYTWNVSPADKVFYATWITVEGPKGVPFQ